MTNRIIITGGSGFIGTNLSAYLVKRGYEILNIDIERPKLKHLEKYWSKCDLLNQDCVEENFLFFQPHTVINLAAETSTKKYTDEEFEVNHVGLKNVLNTIDKHNKKTNVLHFSTMLVNDLGTPVQDLDKYNTTSCYGKSKVKSEELLKKWPNKINWCIARPTSIWGEHMEAPYFDLFKYSMDRESIFFPKGMGKRPFDYMGNVNLKVEKILKDFKICNEKIFYFSDEELTNVFEISREIRIQLNRSYPQELSPIYFKLLGIVGDISEYFKYNFPFSSRRYKNLMTSQDVPQDPFLTLKSNEYINRVDGVKNTLKSIRNR